MGDMSAAGPEFYYSDCGHLVGCSDPTVDLREKRRELSEADFLRCARIVWNGGGSPAEDGDTWAAHGRRSSCQQGPRVCELMDLVYIDPSDENKERVIQARWDHDEWLNSDD
jgi:hypothetical protein